MVPLPNKILTEDAGMTQSKADPWAYKREGKGRVCVILVVHVNDIPIGGETEGVHDICDILNRRLPTSYRGPVVDGVRRRDGQEQV